MKYDFLDPEIAVYLEEFLQGFSDNSRSHYVSAVRGICSAKGSFLRLNSADVLDYFEQLSLKETTKAAVFYSLRSFSVFLTGKIEGYVSPFVFLTIGQCAGDYSLEDFPEETLPGLLSFLGEDSDDALAVNLSVYMCLPVSEICSLRPDMFSFHGDGTATLSLQRVIPTSQSDGLSRLAVPDRLVDPVKCRMDRETLLVNRWGKPVNARLLERHIKASGSGWTFQRLRSYGMLLLLRRGYSRTEVADYAGVDGRWLFRYAKLVP